MTGFVRDLRFGFRMMRKSLGHTAAAVLALGLGIGLTAAMFSILYGVIYRGLPFEQSERILHIENENPERDQHSLEVNYLDFLEMQRRQTSFEGLAAYSDGTVNLSGDGRPVRYDGGFLTAETLRQLRVKPLLGRGFLPGEDTFQAPPVVILGYGVWQTRYQGNRNVLGRTIRINGQPGTIVGVMPQGFEFPNNQEVWIPLRRDLAKENRGQGGSLEVIGRLRDGVSPEQARAEMKGIVKSLAAEFPETNKGLGAVVKPLIDEYVGNTRKLLFTMFGACVFVLLIACTNVASLIMSRASQRTREIAIRSTLGADRWRLVAQLLLESLLLSLLGAALGLVLAVIGVRAFNAGIAVSDPPYWIQIRVDPIAVAFTFGLALLAALAAGLAPAIQASRAQLADVLKDEGRSSSLRLGWFFRAVVIGEVAVSCVLLIGSGLMIKNVMEMNKRAEVPAERLLTSRIALFDSAYPEDGLRRRFFESLLARLEEHPEIEAAAATSSLPASGTGTTHYALDGGAYSTEQDYPEAHIAQVTSGFFDVFHLRALRGRTFGAQDRFDTQPVAIVNRSFAEKAWPGKDPIGRRLRIHDDGKPESWRTVVGVVPDFAMDNIGDSEPQPQGFYVPFSQKPSRFVSLVVRSRAADPLSVTDLVRRQVAQLDRDLPIYFVYSMQEVVDRSGFFVNLFAVLFGIFGICALVLASVGIYGVIALSVEQRTQEIGIRMALGAQRGSVLGLILRQGARQLALGLAAGLLLAWPAARLLSGALVGVKPSDPATFTTVIILLAGVAFFACWIPALRATRTSPLVAIRYD
jgi:predicted permease